MDAFYEMNMKSTNNWSRPNSMMALKSLDDGKYQHYTGAV